MKKIGVHLTLFLIFCAVVSAAGQVGDDEENQSVDDQQAPPQESNILDQTCGFWKHCPQEYACFTFDGLGRRCAKPDPCDYFECKDDKICQEKPPILPGGIPKVKCVEPQAYCDQLNQNTCVINEHCEWKNNACKPKGLQDPNTCFEVWEIHDYDCIFNECGPEADHTDSFETKESCEEYLGSLCIGLRKSQCKENLMCEWIREGWFSGRCEIKGEALGAQGQSECGNLACEEGEAANCTADCTCTTPWGVTIGHGSTITAYQSSSVLPGQQCLSETRTCHSTVLSGTYQYADCTVQPPAACTLDGITVQSGHSHKFFDTRIAENCESHSQMRLCTNGVLDGASSYQYAGCAANLPSVSLTINGQSSITLAPGATFTVAWSSSHADSCTLTNAQGGTTATTPNSEGSSQGATPGAGQTYTYSMSCTNAGGTITKSASVSGATLDPNRGACTYKGQKYNEGATLDLVAYAGIQVPIECDNTVWIYRGVGSNICDDAKIIYDSRVTLAVDLGCRQPMIPIVSVLKIQWRHGKAPYTMNATTDPGWAYGPMYCAPHAPCIYSLSWGDGTSSTITVTTLQAGAAPHTYTNPGTYTISYTDLKGYSNSGEVRVE